MSLIKKACFLFGSGISVHAGMPSALELSNQILTGQNIKRHTDGSYTFAHPPENPGVYSPWDGSILSGDLLLLSQIKAQADVHYAGTKQSNYEDWYYLADQLRSSQGDFDNPAIWEFLRSLRPRIERKSEFALTSRSVEERSTELCNYIRDVVALRLSEKPSAIKLDWIVNAAQDPDIQCQGIFTLNHDTVLEELFEANKVDYTVGFDRQVEGSTLLHWDSQSLFQDTGKIVLVKLHGSVDWRQQNRLGDFLQQKKKEMVAIRRREGDQTPDSEFLLLIGRHNKLYHYTNFLFEDLHYRFYLSLKAANVLVICGYGFGDKGINSRIINWKFSNRDNVIVFVRQNYPFNDEARLGIHQSLQDWQNDPTLLHISENAESVSWNKIKAALCPVP